MSLTRRFLLPLLLAASPLHAAMTGSCEEEPGALAEEAEKVLATRAPESLEKARDLYRRARLTEPSLAFLLRSAELADAAGDLDEEGRLLFDAARVAGELLTPWERLTLARLSEARGDRRGAIFQYGHVMTALSRRGEKAPAWIGERIRRLDVEEEARTLPLRTFPPPSADAQRTFADAKSAAAAGRVASAREGFRSALRLSPGYVEAALALGAVETRSGRTSEAAAAYRTALAADPDSFEAVVSLSNVLWSEPDRGAKEESLALLDRAASLRPDLLRLLKESAERWAEWGDAARALERLDAYRRKASPEETRATDELRARLASRLASSPAILTTTSLPDLSSPALDAYRLAQVLFRRGDAASLASARREAEEAERLDPSFAPALELLAAIEERQGDAAAAEAALRRALKADPARASAHERLAALVARDPKRVGEVEGLWSSAEAAGSREAIFQLATLASRSELPNRSASLFRRYLEESPEGPHADEAREALAAISRRERRLARVALAAAAVALFALLAWARRRAGTTLEAWLSRDPSPAREVRKIAGRLRHEAFKHGGLLLLDAAERIEGDDAEARRRAAELLSSRLFGDAGASEGVRGLVIESRRALLELVELARSRGVRLNLVVRDPLLSPVHHALDDLSKTRRALQAVAKDPAGVAPRARRRLALRIRHAAEVLNPATGNRLGRLVDDAMTCDVVLAWFTRVLANVAEEGRRDAPPLVPLGILASGESLRVRVDPLDWETIWRNLFANALAAAAESKMDAPLTLALAAARERDPITGSLGARFVLADNVPQALTAEMIRGRAAERGLGVVADLVRRHEGFVDVGPPPAGVESLRKGIVLEFSAIEVDA